MWMYVKVTFSQSWWWAFYGTHDHIVISFMCKVWL